MTLSRVARWLALLAALARSPFALADEALWSQLLGGGGFTVAGRLSAY